MIIKEIFKKEELEIPNYNNPNFIVLINAYIFWKENIYLPSYDSEKYFEFKRILAEKILNDLNLKYISVNIENVSNYIDSQKLILKK